MSEQPVAERIRELANDLVGAVDRAKRAVLFPAADTTPGAEYRAAFAGLYTQADVLGTIAREIALDAEVAAPARPLEAVLADIIAEGHETMQVRLSSRLGYWICESETGAEDWNGGDMPAWDAWCARVERGEARGGSAVEAAEARLAQIRRQHAAAVEAVQRDAAADAEATLEQGEALMHFSLLIPEGIVCEATEGAAVSMPEQGVTCPACAAWIREHLAGYADFPGPEEADGEPAADLLARELRQREDAASESGEGA